MKKLLALLLACVMGFSLAACGQQSAAPTSDPTPDVSASTPGDTTEPSDGTVYKWTMSVPDQQETANGSTFQYWADRVNEVTDGHVEVQIYWSSTLLSESDNFTGTRDGICDVCYASSSKAADYIPGATVPATMFANIGNPLTAYDNVWVPYTEKYPEVLEEFSGIEVAVQLTMNTRACIHSSESVGIIKSPEDMQGKVVFAPNQIVTNWFEGCNAAPMTMEVSDWYSSFERGLCEAMYMSWGPILGLSLYEVLPYHTIFPSGVETQIGFILVNSDSWNKLPAEYQTAILGLQNEVEEQACNALDEEFERICEVVESNGGEIYTLTPEEEAAFFAVAEQAVDIVLTEKEQNGIPAKEMYAYIQELGASNK